MPRISAHIDLDQFKFDSTTFNEMTYPLQQDISDDF
jgi:hypothetical protein